MLCAKPLIDFEFSLGAILLPDMNVVLAQAVMGVGKIRIQFECSRILRNRLGIFMLVSVEIAQLHVCFGKLRIKCYRLLQQGLHLAKIEAGIFRPLSLPQTHGVVVQRQRIAGLKL